MISFKNLFMPQTFKKEESVNADTGREQKLKVATCALFLEVASVDDKYTIEEKEKIISAMKELFHLNDKEIDKFLKLSDEEIKKSISVYEFTKVINDYCQDDEKYEILKNLWRLIFADNVLDPLEDNYIRKITNNLNMSHQDMIAAKLEIKQELNPE